MWGLGIQTLGIPNSTRTRTHILFCVMASCTMGLYSLGTPLLFLIITRSIIEQPLILGVDGYIR